MRLSKSMRDALGMIGVIGTLVFVTIIAARCAAAHAAMCTPDIAYTVTPTIIGDHTRIDTAIYRVYAREPESSVWQWHYDIPHVIDPDYGEFASSILSSWPVQRVVPITTSLREVQFTITAIDAAGNESGILNIITICMPLCAEF